MPNNNNNVHFIETNSGKYHNSSNNHPPLYCKICGVRMMFILTGKLAQKYLCGMCGYTVDPNESNDNDEDDDNSEFYSKHKDALRSVDDDNDVIGGKSNNKYDSMIVQSTYQQYQEERKRTGENRQPRMTRQRQQQQYQQLGEDDWSYNELKRDIEADGQRHVVEINNNSSSDNRKLNRIARPR
jgi:hypothetical protein